MPELLPIDAAEAVFRDLGAFPQDEQRIPPVRQLLAAIEAFAAVEFAVNQELPEQDGFFFQYAAVTTFGEVGFMLGFSRQFEVVDAGHEHLGYVHLVCEYHFAADPELTAEGHHEDFWFRSDSEPFPEWMARVSAHPIWRYVETKPPVAFVIYQEGV